MCHSASKLWSKVDLDTIKTLKIEFMESNVIRGNKFPPLPYMNVFSIGSVVFYNLTINDRTIFLFLPFVQWTLQSLLESS